MKCFLPAPGPRAARSLALGSLAPCALALAACEPRIVALSGVVYSGLEEPVGVGGAAVRVLDFREVLVGEATTDDQGAFRADAPGGSAFHVVMEATGFLPTAVSGVLGLTDWAVPDGGLWLMSEAAWTLELQDFDGCPDLTLGDAAVAGSIMAMVDTGSGVAAHVVTTATVEVVLPDGIVLPTCHLADTLDEAVYDPEATVTGLQGRYHLGGIPAGPVQLRVRYAVAEEVVYEGLFDAYAPQAGVGPLFPAWVDGFVL